MQYIKELFIEGKRIVLYYFLKILLIIKEELLSFLSRIQKVMASSCLLLGIIFSIQILTTGYISVAIKTMLISSLLALILYFVFLFAFKPFNNLIFNSLEEVRTKHHNLNCGIYVQKYKIRLLKENNIETILNLKELLETNILLSGLNLKNKLISDDNHNIDYNNILSSGLNMGMALCFSPTTNITEDKTEQNKEFNIENDAFLKNFNKFCIENPNDIDGQIKYLKENKRKINKKI